MHRAHTCPHVHTSLWVIWSANRPSFPCMLAVPSGWRWLMMAAARQIIWVAPSTQDVNQISFANDSLTLIWQTWPEPYRISRRGTKETSISPWMILFDYPFLENDVQPGEGFWLKDSSVRKETSIEHRELWSRAQPHVVCGCLFTLYAFRCR